MRPNETFEQMTKRIEKEQEIKAKQVPWIPLRSQYDNTICQWECPKCHYRWQIYQNEYHSQECEYFK